MKANADLYLDPRQRADGTHSVKIRVTFNRKRRYYSTGINLKAKKSDDKEEHNELELLMNAKRRTDEQKAIYIKLNFYLTKASKIVDSLEVFTFGLFESMYFESRDVHKSVSYAFDEKIKSLITNRQVSTASTYDSAKRSLESFKKDVSFADIDVNFLKRYERWMLDNDRSVTTIGIYLRNLRALFNSKEIDPKLYPFGDGKYEIPTARNVKKALSLEEIALIYNFEADPNTWIETARDYWIFLYLANGMNVKDFTLLRWKDIRNNTLSFVRAKTKNTRKTQKVITVDLKPQLKEIIQKYGKHSLNQNDYVFPHLTHDMTPADLADYLVKKNIPFRDAHHIVAHLVALANQKGKTLAELPLEVYREYSRAFDKDLYQAIDIGEIIKRKKSLGGPAPIEVKRQLAWLQIQIKKFKEKK